VLRVCAQNWTKVAKGSFVKTSHNKRSLMTWNCKGPMEELILGLEIHDRNAARDEISLPHKFFSAILLVIIHIRTGFLPSTFFSAYML